MVARGPSSGDEQGTSLGSAAGGRPDVEPTDCITLGNEFAEVRVLLVRTRNGDRLKIESPRTERSVVLCPMELQALTWQGTATFTAMLGKPEEPLVEDDQL